MSNKALMPTNVYTDPLIHTGRAVQSERDPPAGLPQPINPLATKMYSK